MTRSLEEIDTDLAVVENEVSTLMSSTSVADLTTQVTQLRTDFDTLKGQVHTREEAVFQVSHTGWPVNGSIVQLLSTSFRFGMFVAPFPCKILSLAMVFDYWTIAASDTNYWQISLEKSSDGTTFPDIVNKSTQNTGALAGGGITGRKSWSLDSGAWGDATLNTGDVLDVLWTPHGSPAALKLPVLYTGRYAAL